MEKCSIVSLPDRSSSVSCSSDVEPETKKLKVECVDISEDSHLMESSVTSVEEDKYDGGIFAEDVDVSDLEGCDSDAETVCVCLSPTSPPSPSLPRPQPLEVEGLGLSPPQRRLPRFEDEADGGFDRDLYHGSDKSVDEAVLDVVMDHIRHRGTNESLGANLRTFVKFLPAPNTMPKTLDELFNFVQSDYPISFRSYCTDCLQHSLQQQCNCGGTGTGTGSFIYWFDVREQLKYYFERRNLANVIDEYRCSKNGAESYCDVRDGSEYEKSRFGQYDLTLLWSCQGSRVNSDQTYYLSQAVLCEVPPKLRRQYKLVLWFWRGEKRPPFKTLFFPFVENMKDLNENLVRWTHPDGNERLSLVVAPAVCAFMQTGMRGQLQGVNENECNTCEQKGVPVQKDGGEPGPVYGYLQPPARLREHRRMVVLSQVAHLKDSPILKSVPCIDLATSFYTEYVSVAVGVTKHFLNVWIKVPGPWNENFKMIDFVDLDAKMRSIKSMSEACRSLPPLSKYEEWSPWNCHLWLILYSLPMCRLFLPKEYLDHWSLLVQGVSLLLKREVSRHDVLTAERALNLFVEQVETLYSKSACVRCVHDLLHLPLSVARWGPLWFTSAFQFCSLNSLLNLLQRNYRPDITRLVRFACGIDKISTNVSCLGEGTGTSPRIFHLDPISLRDLGERDRKLLTHRVIDCDQLKMFARAKVGNHYFTSQAYREEGNNSTVAFKKAGQVWFGEIVCFVEPDLSGAKLQAVIKVFLTEPGRMFGHPAMEEKVAHIMPLRRDGKFCRIDCVPVDAICEKLVRVDDFVCRQPYVTSESE